MNAEKLPQPQGAGATSAIRADSRPLDQSAIVPAVPIGLPLGAVSRRAQYLMIESLEIENFRGFESLALRDLKRINILVGDNGVGKTSFLEAVFLASSRGPDPAIRFRPLRGLEMSEFAPHLELYRILWADLFYRFDPNRRVKISLAGSDASRSLTVYYDKDQQITLPLTPQTAGATGASGRTDGYVPVTFHWQSPGRPDTIVTPVATPTGLQMQAQSPSNINSIYVTTHTQVSAKQIADFYSALSKQNKETEFVDALKAQFPQIQSVTVETEGGTNALFVSVPWLERKVSLALVSAGANTLSSVLLSIAQVPKGLVCIDEIEGGLYHARFGKMWQQVAAFAEKYEVQVFSTTHSQECLDAAAETLDPANFALIQMARTNGAISARLLNGGDVASAIKHGLEVRGAD